MSEKELIEQFKEAKDQYESLDSQAKEAKQKLETIEARLVETLEAEGKERSATYEGIGFVSLMKPRVYANYLKENEADLFRFLRCDRPDLVKETVNPVSLSTYVKELFEQGKEIPKYVNYYFKKSVRLYQKGS